MALRKTLHAVDGSSVALSIPYTHMSYEDGCLFYGIMNALLTFANAVLRIVPDQEIMIDGGDRRRQDIGSLVSETLWRHPELVSMFVRSNPFGLTEECLKIAGSWVFAVRDLFVNVGADADAGLHLNESRVFAVGAMEHDADAFVHGIPSLDLLVLLPFKGGIVTDGKVLHLAREPEPFAVPIIKDDCGAALARGVIQTADELIAYSRANRGRNWISPTMQGRVNETMMRIHHDAWEQA